MKCPVGGCNKQVVLAKVEHDANMAVLVDDYARKIEAGGGGKGKK